MNERVIAYLMEKTLAQANADVSSEDSAQADADVALIACMETKGILHLAYGWTERGRKDVSV